MITAQNGLESFYFYFILKNRIYQSNDAKLKKLNSTEKKFFFNPSNLLLSHSNPISQGQLLSTLSVVSLCLCFSIQLLKIMYPSQTFSTDFRLER